MTDTLTDLEQFEASAPDTVNDDGADTAGGHPGQLLHLLGRARGIVKEKRK